MVIRAAKQRLVAENATRVYTLRNMLPQLATLYIVARQVGHKRGNTRNNVFQIAMQQCCETS